VTGTTGERAGLDGSLAGVIGRARASTSVPVAVGFGIGSPAQVAAAAQARADGVIIGSRLVRAAGEDVGAVKALVASFAAALREPPLG
jgi:tryptophan synthase alpha chain